MLSKLTRFGAFVAVVAIASTTLAVNPALAAPGGKPKPSATLTASPNPAAAGTRVTITGCGYKTDAPVEIRIKHGMQTDAYMVGVWSTGCINPTPYTTREAGMYTVEAWQAQSPRVLQVAATSLQVR